MMPFRFIARVALSGFALAILFAQASEAEETFPVELPCLKELTALPYDQRDFYEDDWYDTTCQYNEIQIPAGRPVYALLVSGFHQNKNFDMLHWFDFAKYLQSRGAYVHFAWWNNLLAPYMEKPLHDPGSVPSTGAFPLGTIADARWGEDKAIPNDDFQFQADARALLLAIRAHNPAAKIVLVGHSMGGVSVLRLAESMPDSFTIDLLAPIDPVGNRSCIWDPWGTSWVTDPLGILPDASCNGFFNFTRWRAIRQDMMDSPYVDLYLFYPPKRVLGPNISVLYHRWQQEFAPPYDYSCPGGADDVPWPCASFYDNSLWSLFDPDFFETDYIFDHHGTLTSGVPDVYLDSINVQSKVDTRLESGNDVPVALGNFGGPLDGHGELVGFRGSMLGTASYDFWVWVTDRLAAIGGVLEFWNLTYDEVSNFLNFESYPIGLAVEASDWPSRDQETGPGDPSDPVRLRRVEILKAWEKDPFLLFKQGYEPWNPGLCMVSKDLSKILDFILPPPSANQGPSANAGFDRRVSAGGDCVGHAILDASGSGDPDGDDLAYTWTWGVGQTASGPSPAVQLPLGVHEITLVVNDGLTDSVPDAVTITVVDATPPQIVLNGAANMTLECAVEPWEDPGAFATDNCDPNVAVTLGGGTVSPVAPGAYVVTYDAVDAYGNHAAQATRTIGVQDTLAPAMSSVVANPPELWPPDHSMIPVHFTVEATDACDPSVDLLLASVTCNEPDYKPGGGDGHTTGDIESCAIGAEDYDVLLRAERQGRGNGRTYTVVYSATDDAGNTSMSGVAVQVRHNAPGGGRDLPRPWRTRKNGNR